MAVNLSNRHEFRVNIGLFIHICSVSRSVFVKKAHGLLSRKL